MKAVILAGGKGKRLLPLTKNLPKPLIKIGDKAVIEHQIELLKHYGIKDVWVLAGYLGLKIKKYLQNKKDLGVNIFFQQEKRPLGTAGALKPLERKLNEDFLVLSGDVILDLDVKKFIGWYEGKKEKDKIAAFVVHPTDHPQDSDLVLINGSERIVRLFKRPHQPNSRLPDLGIASVFIFSPKIFRYIPKRKKNDIEKDVLPKILRSKNKTFGYASLAYIKDMGTPERLEKVRKDYLSGKIKIKKFLKIIRNFSTKYEA